MSAKTAQRGFIEFLEGIANGTETIPNAEGTKHHYVPKTALKRFRSSRRKGRQLYELKKSTGDCKPVDPSDVGWEESLYSVKSVSGNQDGMVEALFARAENYASRSIQQLLKHPEQFNSVDRWNIATFVAIQSRRSPYALDEMHEIGNQAILAQKIMELGDFKGSKAERRLAKQARKKLISGELIVEVPRQDVLQLLLGTFMQIAVIIEGMSWTLLNAVDSHFICSDNPVTMKNPNPEQPWQGVGWQSSPDTFATIPLSSRACLRFGHRGLRLAVKPTRTQLDAINARTYAWAKEAVFGPDPDYLTALFKEAEAHPERFEPPVPSRTVILEDPATADPQVALEHGSQGHVKHLHMADEAGGQQKMSYEIIDSVDDIRRLFANE